MKTKALLEMSAGVAALQTGSKLKSGRHDMFAPRVPAVEKFVAQKTRVPKSKKTTSATVRA